MKTIGRWFLEHVVPLGAPGLFLLALIDSGGLPIPQGVDVLLFAQTTAHPAGALYYASLATLGSLAGCVFLYYVSRTAGHAALARRTSPERIDAMRRQFEKYEALTLVLPTMIPLPLPMKLFVIAAGVFQVRLAHFIGAILFARVIRFFGIALLARHYGEQAWTHLRENLVPVAGGVLVLLALFYLASRRWR
jgi:membrane protein YqaA with SNARE-associated domain